MKPSLLAVAFSLALGQVFAAEQTIEQFAEGFTLDLAGTAPMYRVTLTQAVYARSIQQGLRDLAVFNSEGLAVPHQIIVPPRTRQSTGEQSISVPLFPLSEQETAVKQSIELRSDGSLIRIDQLKVFERDASTYIVDASQVRGRIVELKLSLADQPGDFITAVSIDGAAKFGHWHPRVPNFPVAALRYAGRSLQNTTVKIPANDDRYFRVRSLNKQLRLTDITVKTETGRSVVRQPEQLSTLGKIIPDKPAAIEFDLGGSFPIESVAFRFAPNKLFEANLESRDNSDSAWRRRQRGVYYALEKDGLLMRAGSQQFTGVTDRYWRLNGLENEDVRKLSVEMLTAWRPHEVLFVAEGLPPYTLAVGQAESKFTQRPATKLTEIETTKLSGRAVIGQPVTLGGKNALEPTVRISINKIILWGVLLVAVIALALMAIRLSRQMRA